MRKSVFKLNDFCLLVIEDSEEKTSKLVTKYIVHKSLGYGTRTMTPLLLHILSI